MLTPSASQHILECKNCCAPFLVYNSRRGRKQFCSKDCQRADYDKHRAVVVCEICKKEFVVPINRLGRVKYCSKKCMNKSKEVDFIDCACLNCGVHFQVTQCNITYSGSTYCSQACSSAHKRIRTECTCLQCGKVFEIATSRIGQGQGKYCSRKCRDAGKINRIACACENCGIQLELTPTQYKGSVHHCCSKRCAGILKRGDGYDIDGRASDNAISWRSGVWVRDKYTCQKCHNPKHRKLVAHHILPWKYFPEERFNPANGVTLCEDCHRVVHIKIGQRNMKPGVTPEQCRFIAYEPIVWLSDDDVVAFLAEHKEL